MSPHLASELKTTAEALQQFANRVAFAERSEARTLALLLSDSLPSPPDPATHLLTSALLLLTAIRIVEHLHRFFEPKSDCPCATISQKWVCTFLQPTSPLDLFRVWVDEFFDLYDQAHPTTPCELAVRAIRNDPSGHFALKGLSRSVGATPRQLGLAFRAEFGLTFQQFLHMVRIDRALTVLLRDRRIKVESLAFDVGYRSKKDFYRSLRSTIAMTPTDLRRLPTDQIATLRGALEARCARFRAKR